VPWPLPRQAAGERVGPGDPVPGADVRVRAQRGYRREARDALLRMQRSQAQSMIRHS
jgi:hypothetical protein